MTMRNKVLAHALLATIGMGAPVEPDFSTRTAPVRSGAGRKGAKARRAKRKKQRQQAKASRK